MEQCGATRIIDERVQIDRTARCGESSAHHRRVQIIIEKKRGCEGGREQERPDHENDRELCAIRKTPKNPVYHAGDTDCVKRSNRDW